MERSERVMWVFALALLASLSVHLPIWGALGVLAKWWEDDARLAAVERPNTDVELVFQDLDDAEDPDDAEMPEDAEEPEEDPDTQDDSEPSPPDPEVEPEVEEPEPEPEREDVDSQPPDLRNMRAVQQRSQDPSVQAPEDAEFVARENNQVEEQTVAEVTSLDQDDPEPELGEPIEASDAPDDGNADDTEVAESAEEDQGEREATREVAEQAGTTQPAAPAPRSQEARAERSGGVEMETVVINDGYGSFVIERPRAQGTGGGDEGGESQSGRRRRQGSRSGSGRQGGEGPDLRVSWNQFEQVYGEDRLQQEREAYVQERLTKIRGNGQRQRRWADFRAAIENYIPGVRPGNQTALNAAASPYADYISTIHRRIHREFAERFIGSLPSSGSNPMADQSLITKLEIIFNSDGSLHRVGVVRSSGLLPYDFGAFDAVMRGQPYPTPPDAIKSGDGRVYLHWGFYRNGRQCGTWNAEPYILPHPPGTARQREGAVDGLQQDSLVPTDAQPTWRTGDGEGSDAESGESREPPADGDGEGQREPRPTPDGEREGPPPERAVPGDSQSAEAIRALRWQRASQGSNWGPFASPPEARYTSRAS